MRKLTDIKKQEHSRIQESEELSRDELLAILEHMHDTFYRTDTDGSLIYLTSSVKALLGYEPSELIGSRLSDLYVENNGREKFLLAFQAAGGDIQNYEAPLKHKNGSVVWVSTNAHYYFDHDGNILGIEGNTRDATSRIQQQQELNRLKTTLDKTLDCVFMFEPKTLKFFYVNEGAMKQIGYSSEELLEMTPYDIKPAFTEDEFREMLKPLVNGQKESLTFETIHRHKDGSELNVEIFLQYIAPENEEPRYVAIVRDLSERIEVQEKLRYLAHHDSLTGLPNRVLFLDRLEHALARRPREENLAVFFLDLDRFKVINDTLGHSYGDKVLQLLGERVGNCIRKGDTLARISGDEFAIIIEDLKSLETIAPLARHILTQLEQPFDVDGHELFVTASIGISISPNDGDDSQTLLKHADIAMYRSKDIGRNTYQFYSPDMSSKAFERLNLETSLRYALERNQFHVLYQPLYDVNLEKVMGVEALLRWEHPELGLIGTMDFIPLLEETGLIIDVGAWVLNVACQQVKEWQDRYGEMLQVSVNLSPRQFNDDSLVEKVRSCLTESGLNQSSLELEITENIILQDKKWLLEAFKALEKMGVRFAIDDFGTGYSSLSYLKRFPIKTIKIDRRFIRGVCADTDDAAIVTAIIAMTGSLKLRVIAEGVETKEQLVCLKEKGCDVVQGYYFSEPVSADDMEKILNKQVGLKQIT